MEAGAVLNEVELERERIGDGVPTKAALRLMAREKPVASFVCCMPARSIVYDAEPSCNDVDILPAAAASSMVSIVRWS